MLVLLPLSAAAQIRTDASLGRPAASLTGPNYLISQDLGRLAGRNLFHSFETFNLGYGEIARFTTTSSHLANVISRVTGGDISRIYGSIHLASPGAPTFWFLNPAGVVFGSGASISVPGAFHVSTANYLKFADGMFHADPAKTSTFSTLPPEAFGFLGTTRASIRIEDGGVLRANSPIQLVAGDLSLNRGAIAGGVGDVRIVALGARSGEVPVSGPVAEAGGGITLADGGNITTHSSGGSDAGNIEVYAGTLTLDGAGSANPTGFFSVSEAGSRGNTGSITVDVGGGAAILDGAAIGTETFSAGGAGRVRFTARELTIDGKEVDDTGIYSLTSGTATGSGGDIVVEVGGALKMFNGAVISSDTDSSGNAGSVKVSAQTILIDGLDTLALTGISSDTREESTGMGSGVEVLVRDLLTIRGTGEISSNTHGRGDAGAVKVTAGTLLIDGSTSSEYSSGIYSASTNAISGNAGNVEVHVAGTATILAGGEITADTFNAGRGGNVLVTARNLTIDGTKAIELFTGISSEALSPGGSAGGVEVRVAENLTLLGTAQISSDTFSDGNAGMVRVEAANIFIDGNGRSTGISSDTVSGSGSAGNVFVRAREGLFIFGAGYITSASLNGTGRAGVVTVEAGRLLIDGRNANFFTGIGSQSFGEVTGAAGDVRVTVTGDANLLKGGSISSATNSTSPAGTVSVSVGGDLDIREGVNGFTGISTSSNRPRSGAAGDVTVNVGQALSITGGGAVSSDTFSAANAGSVSVTAATLRLEGQDLRAVTGISSDALAGSSGHAGNVDVRVAGEALILSDARVSSITLGAGNAGRVSMHAGALTIDGQASPFLTGISTQSSSSSSGHAGTIAVEVDGALSIIGGGTISSSTVSANGRAGSIDVTAASVRVSGFGPSGESTIGAFAQRGSSGQTGSITMTARESISVTDGGRISIENDATVPNPAASTDSGIVLTAPEIRLASDGIITAASEGNGAASSIQVNAPGTLALNGASISTSANLGNGGAIRIDAGTVDLRNSQITTSVGGASGNGGDISVRADVLKMETGFIQANTAAANATGGNVSIDTGVLIASGSLLFIGGLEPLAFHPGVFGLNVIQAAAPTGVSGAIELTSPVLDTSGALAGLGAPALDTSGIGRSPCRVAAGSSLAQRGRGGLAPSALGFQRVDPSNLPSAGEASAPRFIVQPLGRSIPCA